MLSIEDIIANHLCSQFNNGTLAQYADTPAVFNTQAPDDMDEYWNDAQYPRVIFDLNMQADAERKISGQLLIDVMCENETSSVQPEELESIARTAVDGCFFSNETLTISAQWNSSDVFNENDNKVSGITLVFDILAYPVQETEEPDPVSAVNLWLKTLYPKAYVIGKDVLSEVWIPNDEAPAIYCRLSNVLESSRIKSTAAVTWLCATMNINIIAPSEKVRSIMIKHSIQILQNATRLILNDGSPMLIDNVSGNMAADPLREGQIQIKATYGVLNTYTGTPIKQIYMKSLNAEREVRNNE